MSEGDKDVGFIAGKTLVAGTTITIGWTITGVEAADIQTMTWGLSDRHPDNPDDTVPVTLITKTIGNGITIEASGEDDEDTLAQITIAPDDTDGLEGGIYWHWLRYTLTSITEESGWGRFRLRGAFPTS